MGEAEIEALLTKDELQALTGSAANGEPWLDKARRTFESAMRLAPTDPSSAYVLAYDAARQACVGLLAHQGLRPTSRGGHYAVERAVTAQFGDRSQSSVRFDVVVTASSIRARSPMTSAQPRSRRRPTWSS